MIRADRLSKSFPKKTNAGLGFGKRPMVEAVSNISFEAENACITGLLGANGAGKSTTLRMIATLIKPDAGTAIVDGFDVRTHALEARAQLGFLPHNSGIYPRLTAIENIRYYAELSGMAKATIAQRVEELVDQLEMSSFAQRRTEGFSQGQRTKVALARALVHKPKTLILDEPTNGLDVMATRNLRQIINKLKQDGHCIVFSSHVMQEVTALCDRVVIVHNGRVALSGSIEEILSQTECDDMEEAFIRAVNEEEKVSQ